MVTPEEMLRDARSILTEPSGECRRRTVISRAYYSAYHFMLEQPFCAGFQISVQRGAGMHKQFLDFLKQTGNREILRARSRLRRLYESRLFADYRPDMVVTPNMAREAITDAEEIMEIFSASGQADEDNVRGS